MQRTCKGCFVTLPIESFYKNSKSVGGRDWKCKTCVKAAVKINREKNKEYYLIYDRARANRPSRVAARKAYAKTSAAKKSMAKSQVRWMSRNPEKRAAHIMVGNAIRDGRLTKERCMECGSDRAQAHHEDYSNPLDVVWLCAGCHAAHHKKERALSVRGMSFTMAHVG
ncbi:hypothetical protein WSS15_23440 [Acetobacter pasteurianus]|nr:hypothetical protein WSS15_23440 [Acetobacter pasteurianus]